MTNIEKHPLGQHYIGYRNGGVYLVRRVSGGWSASIKERTMDRVTVRDYYFTARTLKELNAKLAKGN
jgi:hypothetical protein